MKFAALRKDYRQQQLNAEQMQADPMEQFACWFQQARDAELIEPNAMVLATADPEGRPSQRHVLLKHFDEQGFVFFTNRSSRKAGQIEANPSVSLLFAWLGLERQVAIDGSAEPLTRTEVLRYFLSRPRNSQLAAWASQQSRPIASRTSLESRFTEIKEKFAGRSVPPPRDWGGYRIKPRQLEFWQGGSARLHDRFLYQRDGEHWQLQRLAP